MNWLIVIIAVIGAALNIAGRWQGFGLWIISNGYWLIYNLQAGEYAQSVIFAVFLALAIYGIVRWRCSELIEGQKCVLPIVNSEDVPPMPAVKAPLVECSDNILKQIDFFLSRIIRTEKVLKDRGPKLKINWLPSEARPARISGGVRNSACPARICRT